MPCRVAFAAAALLLLAASARAEEVDSPQAEPAAASRVEAAGAPRAEAPAQRLTDPPLPGDAVKDETADDPDAQAEVDKSAAELEAVRKAEEKAGLLPRPPGAGAHDGLQVGVDAFDPLARDLATALGSGLDGAPLADPAPAGSVSARLPELLGISEDELRAKYDIPVELNDAVVAYIRFFQTDTREAFGRWLARSTRYLPMMRQVLEKRGLPLDLVYLSMIESGFSSYAYSFAKAAGLWQFMVGTSRRYGLHTDFWVDERRDPAKSTEAAARYLSDLRARYHGDWYLAWAGYNAGEGKVDRAIRNDKSKDFWMLMGKGRTLRAETKHYVPKLIAAALIAKHPERFGFHVNFEPPAEVDEVQVPDATDLHVIAKAAGVTFEQVRDLNPELRRFCTPPGGWKLRLPKGTRETFAAEYEKLGPGDRLRLSSTRSRRASRSRRSPGRTASPRRRFSGPTASRTTGRSSRAGCWSFPWRARRGCWRARSWKTGAAARAQPSSRRRAGRCSWRRPRERPPPWLLSPWLLPPWLLPPWQLPRQRPRQWRRRRPAPTGSSPATRSGPSPPASPPRWTSSSGSTASTAAARARCRSGRPSRSATASANAPCALDTARAEVVSGVAQHVGDGPHQLRGRIIIYGCPRQVPPRRGISRCASPRLRAGALPRRWRACAPRA